MWVYVQGTGDFFAGSTYVETGYSGRVPDGRNDSLKECVKNVGPIPRGYYSLGTPKANPTPFTFPLTADNPNYCSPNRSGFLIHGDNSTGTASTGCIVLSRKCREMIAESDDRRLRVVVTSKWLSHIKRRRRSETMPLR